MTQQQDEAPWNDVTDEGGIKRFTEPIDGNLPFQAVHYGGWHPPSRRNLSISLALLGGTFLTTLVIGAVHMATFQNAAWLTEQTGFRSLMTHLALHPRDLAAGLPYACALILILLSHELGHYLFCWYYDVDVTPPMFLPAPTLFGTFGAFIRIKTPIPHRRALFDIGLAGPLAGFIVTLPFLAYGIAHSRVSLPHAPHGDMIIFGEPLLWKIFAHIFRKGMESKDILVHPVAMAAWFGILATNLNLFPIGQLDGGHVSYAVSRDSARRIGLVVWLILIALVIRNYVWTFWAIMTFFIGFRHPPTIRDAPPLPPSRWVMTGLAVLVFILTFSADPIHISG